MNHNDCILCLLNWGCFIHNTESGNLNVSPKVHTFRKGQILLNQDQPNQELYFIMEGVVKIYSLCESGKKTIHALLPAGEIAGISALAENQLSPYTAEALEDSKLCILDKNEVLELFKTHPAFIHQFLSKVSKAQEGAYIRNDNLINYKVRERMAKCLLELAEKFGDQEGCARRINLKLNREELASIIGVAPETAIRFLSEFKRSSLITEDDHQLILLNEKRLRSIAENNYPKDIAEEDHEKCRSRQ